MTTEAFLKRETLKSYIRRKIEIMVKRVKGSKIGCKESGFYDTKDYK